MIWEYQLYDAISQTLIVMGISVPISLVLHGLVEMVVEVFEEDNNE